MGFIKDLKVAVSELLPDFGEESCEEEAQESEYKDPSVSMEKDISTLEEELAALDRPQTIIDEQTRIKGNVESDADMELRCFIEGTVMCYGKLELCGNIIGDVVAGELYMNHSHIEGNVDVNIEAVIDEFSVINGNLRASEARISGTIHGSLDVRGSVVLESTAQVFGDIKAQEMKKKEGARQEGAFTKSYMEFPRKGQKEKEKE